MTAKEIKALLRDNDTVTFKIRGLGDNLYVFSRTFFGSNGHSIEAVRMHEESFTGKSMNVNKVTNSSLKLYTYDMFNHRVTKTLKFSDMYEIEAL